LGTVQYQYLPEDFPPGDYEYAPVDDFKAASMPVGRPDVASHRRMASEGTMFLRSIRRPAGLFITHVCSDRISVHFSRLKQESGHLIDWQLIYHTKTLQELARDQAGRIPKARLDQAISRGSFRMGYLDVVFVPLALEARRKFVWICEYDVDYSGNWANLFHQFADDSSDLLATTIELEAADPSWGYWSTAVQPSHVSATIRTRSFLPLFRVSQRLLKAYWRAVSTGQWAGHCEFLVPTIARAHRLTIEDLGSHGSFTRTDRVGRNYINSPHDPYLVPGTFVFRPTMSAYFHEEPENFEHGEMLYHPVKPGVNEWSPDNLDA
jgi:hypothetical protein